MFEKITITGQFGTQIHLSTSCVVETLMAPKCMSFSIVGAFADVQVNYAKCINEPLFINGCCFLNYAL